MFTEAESIKILRHDLSERKLPRSPLATAFQSPNIRPRSSAPGNFAPTALLSSQKGMSIPAIAGAIERTADQLRAIPRRTTTKSETLTRAQLEDLVFCRVRLPFSLSGYELNSQIAAVVRTSNMEQWWAHSPSLSLQKRGSHFYGRAHRFTTTCNEHGRCLDTPRHRLGYGGLRLSLPLASIHTT